MPNIHTARQKPLQVQPILETVVVLDLHPSEVRLIAFIRELGHGSMEIRVQDGYPVLIERVIERVKLV